MAGRALLAGYSNTSETEANRTFGGTNAKGNTTRTVSDILVKLKPVTNAWLKACSSWQRSKRQGSVLGRALWEGNVSPGCQYRSHVSLMNFPHKRLATAWYEICFQIMTSVWLVGQNYQSQTCRDEGCKLRYLHIMSRLTEESYSANRSPVGNSIVYYLHHIIIYSLFACDK